MKPCPTKTLLALCLLLTTFTATAQKREEIFDHAFQPTGSGGYYFVVTEKKGTVWERKAYYLSQKTTYMEGSYLDEACTQPQGVFNWYHPTRYLKETGAFEGGKKQGVWLGYNEQGLLNDSANYQQGRRIGIAFSWYNDGSLRDSLQFDGKGNGVQVSWYDDGSLASAGYWMQDTLRKGSWKYYHRNGQLLATETYAAGKLQRCDCYDDKGQAIDTALCREQEPSVERQKWMRFLETNLQPLVESKAAMGISGQFTVLVRFLVDAEGLVSDIRPLTNYGYGIEEGVTQIMKRSPKWQPGRQHGKKVRSYHTQPITFVIN